MSPGDSRPRVFYTDSEFGAVFGGQAAKAVEMLGNYAQDICRDCAGECCRRIKCEFYSDRFPACPIFEYRPAKCRLYFCERILENETLTEKERDLLNQPARELSDALKRGWGVGIFIEPPVTVGEKSWLTALGIKAEVSRIRRSLEKGSTRPDLARSQFLEIVARCRGDV